MEASRRVILKSIEDAVAKYQMTGSIATRAYICVLSSRIGLTLQEALDWANRRK